MKIIITGATGSLGAYLTRHFSNHGHQVIATGIRPNPPEELLKFATYIKADITQPFTLPEADVCIHTAAKSDDAGARADFYQANVVGTRNVLRAAVNCKTFIPISSSSVYLSSDKPLKEDIAGKQNNRQLSLYGESKLGAEKEILQNNTFQSVFILRPRALYGTGDKMIIPRMLRLEKNRKIFTPGSMKIDVSLTHYANLVQAVELCVNSEKTGIHIYNVADKTQYVLVEVLRKITRAIYGETLAEKKIPIIFLKLLALFHLGGMSKLLIRALTKNMVLDISKIEQELSYSPTRDIDNSLNEITTWVTKIGGPEVLKKAEKKLAWIY